jgi:hypothetical protein
VLAVLCFAAHHVLVVTQVIECRRILKWTYAYGYYNFEDEDLPQVNAHVENGSLLSSWVQGGSLRGFV